MSSKKILKSNTSDSSAWLEENRKVKKWKGDFITWGVPIFFFFLKMEQTLHSPSYGSQKPPRKEKKKKKKILTSYLDHLKK